MESDENTWRSERDWYFEGTFLATLRDTNGQIVAQSSVKAQSDWMTEEMVPFAADLTFTKPETSAGVLILEKANPSGLPEYDDERRVDVVF